MKNNIFRIAGLIIILLLLISADIIILVTGDTYPISKYFPLNTNDKYIYDHYEGGERGDVSITVKNVKQLGKEKYFNFFWQGKYNDRIQSVKLSPRGIIFCNNRHLVGQIPLKVIRKLTPPLF